VLINRVVPVLLIHDGLLVKNEKFKKPVYVGDPVNAVRIFNDKEVDELVVLDMDPCRTGSSIKTDLIEEIAGEAFMPVAYGGGIDTAEKARALVGLGIEKVVINSAATKPGLIASISAVLGSQAVVGSVDVKRRRGKTLAWTAGGSRSTGESPLEVAQRLVSDGVGEVFLNSIDRDGTMTGLDLDLIRTVSAGVPVPVLACGGAGGLDDLRQALTAGASAVAAGSMFVFHGRHRAVLITYPARSDILAMMRAIEAAS
jgi:imidazole glycerol-phosphate synthase subunit HisF